MPDLITRYKADSSDFDKKTKAAQKALEQFGIKGTEVGNKVGMLTNALTTNMGALSKLSVGLGAAAGALKVASDAFKQNEILMDDWNVTIEEAKGLYDGFLNALNTGDISGFLSRIGTITSAAREAYNALDDLGTFNAFNQIQVEQTRTAFTDAVADFKAGKGSKQAVEEAAKAMKAELDTRQKYEQNAYEKQIEKLAAARGVDANRLKEVLSGKYGAYQDLKELGLSGQRQVFRGGGMFGGGGIQYEKVAANEEERLGEMLRKLSDDELQALQAIGAQAQRTATEIAQVDKQVARYAAEGSVKNSTKKATDQAIEGSIRYYEELIRELNKSIADEVSSEARDAMNNTIRVAKAEIERLKTGTQSATMASLTSGATVSGIDMSNLQLDPRGLKNATTFWDDYAKSVTEANKANMNAIQSIGQVGASLATLNDPMAKVAGMVMEAIANVAGAFAKSLAGTATPWDFIAGAAAGTATMIATISSIKSATRFANGGIVPGNSYSGDKINGSVFVNSGELILNRAQQGAIASQLQSDASGRQEVEFRIGANELVGILRQADNIKSFR